MGDLLIMRSNSGEFSIEANFSNDLETSDTES